MKAIAIGLIAAVLSMPVYSSAQSATDQPGEIQVELARENRFVVKMMSVFNTSGNKISGLKDLDSFSIEKGLFVFKTNQGKLRRISAGEIKKIAFARVRQGVLTGKSPKLRVVAWNGAIKNLDLPYADVKIKDGYLYLSRNEYETHFDASGMLSSNSHEWSSKFNQYWAKVKRDAPVVFSTEFAFQDGRAGLSRKMAAAYCRNCVKIEILDIQPNPAAQTIKLRCKEVFYDRWQE